MGARPSSFKKSGGFLNNVAGVISDYQFTDEFNGEPFKAGKDPKTKKEKFHSLFFLLSVRVDGADEDVTTTLFAGDADKFDVSEDGHALTPSEDGFELGQGTPFHKFLASLVENGFPDSRLPEEELDFSCILGTRIQLTQKEDVEGTKRLGKRKGKDGKEYSRTDLVVTDVLELPSEGKGADKGKKTAAKPAVKAGKSKAKPAEEEEEELAPLAEAATTTLLEILGKTNPIAKGKVRMTILSKYTKHPQRDEMIKYLFDDNNLTELAGADDAVITFEKTTGLISLAEAA